MEPENVETLVRWGTIIGFFGSIAGAFGISKWAMNDHEKRISELEGADTVKENDCARLRSACPVLLMIEADRQVLQDIKSTQTTMLSEIRREFERHNALHVRIAEDIGGMKEALKR